MITINLGLNPDPDHEEYPIDRVICGWEDELWAVYWEDCYQPSMSLVGGTIEEAMDEFLESDYAVSYALTEPDLADYSQDGGEDGKMTSWHSNGNEFDIESLKMIGPYTWADICKGKGPGWPTD